MLWEPRAEFNQRSSFWPQSRALLEITLSDLVGQIDTKKILIHVQTLNTLQGLGGSGQSQRSLDEGTRFISKSYAETKPPFTLTFTALVDLRWTTDPYLNPTCF